MSTDTPISKILLIWDEAESIDTGYWDMIGQSDLFKRCIRLQASSVYHQRMMSRLNDPACPADDRKEAKEYLY